METINVNLCRPPNRKNWVMRCIDPENGKQVWKTSGTPNQSKALKAAALWEAEVREGRYVKPSKVLWSDFREQYQRDKLDGMKESTAAAYSATLNVFERTFRPNRLAKSPRPS